MRYGGVEGAYGGAGGLFNGATLNNPTFTGVASFGGTTASFPSLVRNGTGLEVKLADGSAYTTLSASGFYLGAAASASSITTSANNVNYTSSSASGTHTFKNNGGGSTQATFGVNGDLNIAQGVATPAGGSTSARLVIGSTSGFGVYVGSGAPTVSAAQGSIYLRSDGSSTSTRLYVNTNGTTGWTNVTTAA